MVRLSGLLFGPGFDSRQLHKAHTMRNRAGYRLINDRYTHPQGADRF